MLEKARGIEVGEVILDLEDSVVPERKHEALKLAVAALSRGGFRAPAISVRINARDTEWADIELTELAGAPGLNSIIVPKVERDDQLAGVAHRVQALVETATGVQNLREIASAADAIVLGYVDLAASLGRSPAGARNLDLWLAIQDAFLTAARAARIRAIDGPHVAIDDSAGLAASARRAAELGFDAKWAIHPSQLGPIADAFTPSAEEVEHAQAVLDALGTAARAGDGAVALNGEMLDEPVRLAALRTLERAGVSR
jgi:citrate lyase subunit beta/citryl-CoA lyase